MSDIVAGLRIPRVWWLLGSNDIRVRYRRSAFGQLWITLSMGITVGALGLLYSYLFKRSIDDYLPFIAISLVIWTFIAALVTESCQTFIGSESYMKNLALPYSTYALRMVVRNLLALAHNALILPIVFLVLGTPISPVALLAIPGIVIIAVNGMMLGLALGAIAARYRDITQIIASLMQMAFFLSPVIWQPSQLGPEAQLVMDFNPFHHMIAIIREPLLGRLPEALNYQAVLAITIVSTLICGALFAKAKPRLVYWL